MLTDDEITLLRAKFFASLPEYAEGVLQVTPREGGKRIKFEMRTAQRWLHAQLQAEVAERGFVRALIPKARQLGVSTYIAARYFHRTTHSFGTSTFVMAHKSDATTNLFNMVKGYYGDAQELARLDRRLNFAPAVSASNARELNFDKLMSKYRVGTAEGQNVGVSQTNQLLHLSEVALYPDAGDLAMGLMNTVHLMPGTEVIMESTGRGPTGMFHAMCMQAMEEENRGLYRCYFLPWKWDTSYTARAPEGWLPPEPFVDYAMLHELNIDQLYWFYLKNMQTATMYSADPSEIHYITKQEYPMTLEESFQSSTQNKFFLTEAVARASVARTLPSDGMPRILAIDPALDGGDASWACDRQGLALGTRVWQSLNGDMNAQADQAANLATQHRMNAIIVDATGLGIGLVSLLRLKVPAHINVIPVVFSSKAMNPRAYANRRAELHDLFRMWVHGDAPYQPSIPRDQFLLADMAALEFKTGECYRDDRNLLHVTKKEKIKELNAGRSPDRMDAAILTTAFPDAYINRLTAGAS